MILAFVVCAAGDNYISIAVKRETSTTLYEQKQMIGLSGLQSSFEKYINGPAAEQVHENNCNYE